MDAGSNIKHLFCGDEAYEVMQKLAAKAGVSVDELANAVWHKEHPLDLSEIRMVRSSHLNQNDAYVVDLGQLVQKYGTRIF